MEIDWKDVFDVHGEKVVTRTDKSKNAYVPNLLQRHAIEAAGIRPAETRPAPEFRVLVLSDPGVTEVKASYYYANRSESAHRTPEPRLGREFIRDWLNPGDHVVIGSIGSEVFAIKSVARDATEEEVVSEVAKRASPETVLERAGRASGKPPRKEVTRNDFVRDPYVVAAAIIRSNGGCEMPDCKRGLFLRSDGSPYLEVHHVVPLAEGGDDALRNAAALCPHCHREQHYGENRATRRRVLAEHIGRGPA